MKNILVVSNGNIGDFIMQTGALKLLRQNRKQDRIVLIAHTKIKDFADNLDFYDNVIYADFSFSGGKIARILERLFWFFKNYLKIKRQNFDDCIFLDHSRFFATALSLFKIKNLIGPSTWWCGNNFKNPYISKLTHIVNLPKNSDKVHMIYRYQTIIRDYLGNYSLAYPSFLPRTDSKDAKKADFLLARSKKYAIALSLRGDNIKGYERIYPIEFAIETIENLSKLFSIDFYFVGAKFCWGYAENIKEKLPNLSIINLCGKTSLLELKAVFEKIDLLISVDTGAVHIAAATKTKIIGIYSGTDYRNSGPAFNGATILYSKEPCSPCNYSRTILKKPCPYGKNPKCLENIKPPMVVEATKRILLM